MQKPILAVNDLHAHYGKSHILHGVDFALGHGDIVSILGRNGSGRSTMLKAMMGIVKPTAGTVVLDGVNIAGERPFRIACDGLAYVPEERLVFNNLTVDENLRMGIQRPHSGFPTWGIDQMYEWFPRLAERRNTRAGSLSGGEQQMLTICRSLLGNPKVILIDEPTEGLAPKIVETVMDVILQINRAGTAIILVEQKLTIALQIARQVFVMGHGKIVFAGTPAELRTNTQVIREWLEVN